MKLIHSLEMSGLLSFPPDMPPFVLNNLNVLIGPNGSGKSNVLEVLNSFAPHRQISPQQSVMAAELWSGSGKEKPSEGLPK